MASCARKLSAAMKAVIAAWCLTRLPARPFKTPLWIKGDIDMDRVYAQQARRFLDRVVGFELSPLLGKGGPWLVRGPSAECRSAANCRA